MWHICGSTLQIEWARDTWLKSPIWMFSWQCLVQVQNSNWKKYWLWKLNECVENYLFLVCGSTLQFLCKLRKRFLFLEMELMGYTKESKCFLCLSLQFACIWCEQNMCDSVILLKCVESFMFKCGEAQLTMCGAMWKPTSFLEAFTLQFKCEDSKLSGSILQFWNVSFHSEWFNSPN